MCEGVAALCAWGEGFYPLTELEPSYIRPKLSRSCLPHASEGFERIPPSWQVRRSAIMQLRNGSDTIRTISIMQCLPAAV